VEGIQRNPGDAGKKQGTEAMSTSGVVGSRKLPGEHGEPPAKGTSGRCWVGKLDWKRRLVLQRHWEIV